MTMRAIRQFLWTLCTALSILPSLALCTISSWEKSDPYPLFSALDPHYFVLTKKKVSFRDPDAADRMNDFITIAASPFEQSANRGRDLNGNKFLGSPAIPPTTPIYDIQLSDLEGRPNMLTLLYGNVPQGQTLAPALQNARNQLFPDVVGTINDPTLVDPHELFACYSFPQHYVKRGARFALYANIRAGFGIGVETGYVSLTQELRGAPINQNCNAVPDCGFTLTSPIVTIANVNTYLMDQFHPIFHQIGYGLENYTKHGWEELRLSVFWRDAFEINREEYNWAHVLAIPFFELTGSIAPGKVIDLTCQTPLFAAPIGNNGHNAIGFSTGINFDFIETVEVGIEGGITHFFPRDIHNMHIPTSVYQTGIFPFATDVTLQPGMNWHFGAKLAAYHFVDRLSGHFQYLIVEHKDNQICLKNPDPAFLPKVLEKRSGWKSHMIDAGATYDISPNAGFAFVWQAPTLQRNAYRSSTILFSIYGTF
jgi:hypothetical protein